jgi:hypothetical protein
MKDEYVRKAFFSAFLQALKKQQETAERQSRHICDTAQTEKDVKGKNEVFVH